MSTLMRRKNRKRDHAYLEWIRSLACVVHVHRSLKSDRTNPPFDPFHQPFPPQGGPTEAHHAGVRGLMQRAPDRTALPLSAEMHRYGADSVHVLGKNFWTHHGLDRYALIAEYNRAYDASRN